MDVSQSIKAVAQAAFAVVKKNTAIGGGADEEATRRLQECALVVSHPGGCGQGIGLVYSFFLVKTGVKTKPKETDFFKKLKRCGRHFGV